MTYAVTIIERGIAGIDRFVDAKIDLTSYTAAGEVPTAADFGLQRIKEIDFKGPSDEGYDWRWDGTKIRATGQRGVETQIFPDIKGANNANQVASGAAGLNDAVVHAAAGVVTTVVNTGITNPDFPRNLKIVLSSAAGGTLPADCGTVTFIGTDQFDAAVTEALALSPVNGVVLGAGGVVFIVTTKVFKTLTSYQFSINLAASIADIQASVSIGTRLGLLAPITAEADIKAVQKNTAAIAAATYDGSATTHSVLMGGNLADNDEVYITFQTAKGEILAGVDAGETRVRVWGR